MRTWQHRAFELTPRQSFRMPAAIHGLDRTTEATRVGMLGELLVASELFDQPVRGLSLGRRMRCELAAVLLREPAVLFLDEPTIGLDLLAEQRLRELLVRLNEERGTTIFARAPRRDRRRAHRPPRPPGGGHRAAVGARHRAGHVAGGRHVRPPPRPAPRSPSGARCSPPGPSSWSCPRSSWRSWPTWRRRAAQREWRSLLHTLMAYGMLGDKDRERLIWTQLVTIWQVIGRLLRGGQPAKV